MSHFEDHVHYRCLNCELIFEEGIADPGPKGEPRCPQCFLLDSEPYQPQETDFVVTRGTKFR